MNGNIVVPENSAPPAGAAFAHDKLPRETLS